jgi:hypothetical protein
MNVKKKSKAALSLIILLTVFCYLQKSTQANNLSNQLIIEKVAEFQSNDFSNDEDKILAVCQSTPKILGGWVVIGQDNIDACRNNSIAQPLYNAWYIKKPGKQEWVCQGSPLPDNYIVSDEVKIADCPGGSPLIENKNGWIIKLID